MTNYSFEELRDKIRAAVQAKNKDPTGNKMGTWPYRIEPAPAVTKGSVVIENYDDNKYYEYDFSLDDDDNVVLGESKEVQKVESWKAVKSQATVFAVEKSKDHVMFTGTVLIPGEPDCDAENGEELLTEAKVAKMAHSYMDYRIVDKEHEYFETGEEVGKPVESYLLPEPTVIKSMDGTEREFPKGTWVAKTKITDPDSQKLALKGELFYSATVMNKNYADKIIAGKSTDRVLIKHVTNPAGVTLTLTKNPCVDNSCSAKSKAAMKAGRSISKQNKSILEKARDAAKDVINTIDNVLAQANPKNGGDNVTEKSKEKEYVTKSDLEDFKTEISDTIKEATKSKEEEPTCWKCESKIVGKSKFCSECGDSLDKTANKFKEESEETGEEGNGSKAIKNHDDGKDAVAFKSVEHYAGRDLKGRPLKKDKGDK